MSVQWGRDGNRLLTYLNALEVQVARERDLRRRLLAAFLKERPKQTLCKATDKCADCDGLRALLSEAAAPR